MVGGPVFGPQPRLKQALVVVAFVVAFVVLAVGLSALIGCSTHSYLYRPVPAEMIPEKLTLKTVKSAEIPRCEAGQPPCMTDETYIKFVENDRALKQQIDELRALLGADRADTAKNR